MLSQKYTKAWKVVLSIEAISTSATSDCGPSLWAAGMWMVQSPRLRGDVAYWTQILDSVDAVPCSVAGLLCDTGQLISSHHLCYSL